MKSLVVKNAVYTGANGRDSLYDLEIPDNWNGKVVIFMHGYMGFKDWGAWGLMMDSFTTAGYAFVKYNVSHNGGTVEEPIDFPDLESFSRNRYSYEVQDLQNIFMLISEKFPTGQRFHLIGHSRGGGIALLFSDNPRVERIATLAAISDVGSRFPKAEALKQWKETGYYTRKNGRTLQEMPHSYEQFLDFKNNQQRLNIEDHCRNHSASMLIIHGEEDTSVPISEGEAIASWSATQLIRIPDQAHTFGAAHPWTKNQLPLGLEQAIEYIRAFFDET